MIPYRLAEHFVLTFLNLVLCNDYNMMYTGRVSTQRKKAISNHVRYWPPIEKSSSSLQLARRVRYILPDFANFEIRVITKSILLLTHVTICQARYPRKRFIQLDLRLPLAMYLFPFLL